MHDTKITQRSAFALLAFVCLGWLPELLGEQSVGTVSNLFALADSPHPYFVPQHALLLYAWSPLVVLSACLLLLSPGLFLSLAFWDVERANRWILYSGAMSLILVSAATAVIQAAFDASLIGMKFILLLISLSVVSFGILLLKITRGAFRSSPFARSSDRATICLSILLPALVLIGLTPKFYWENFNGDGVHAFESARLLLKSPLPFWPTEAGSISAYPGVTSMLSSYPISWFIRLFGELEASARLPFVFYLGLLLAAVLALIEEKKERLFSERLLIAAGLAVYAVITSFNVTYSPYMADIALPTARETLFMVLVLGFLLSFLNKENGWMAVFLFLAFFTLPSASLLISLWLLSAFLVMRPKPWHQLVFAFVLLAACLLLNFVAPYVFNALQMPAPGQEFSSHGLLYRLRPDRPHLRRILFVIVPCGIIPAFSVFAWRKQDGFTRAIVILMILYFGFFAVQSHIGLHYFIPVMILPVVTFWRTELILAPQRKSVVLAAVGLGAVTALLLSLPYHHMKPDTSARTVGAKVLDRTEGYERSEAAPFRNSELLFHLFPKPWDKDVPQKRYGGQPLTWLYYAHHSPEGTRSVNYILQPVIAEPPRDGKLLAQDHGAALFVLNESVWAEDKAMRPSFPACSPLYSIPKSALFPKITGSASFTSGESTN